MPIDLETAYIVRLFLQFLSGYLKKGFIYLFLFTHGPIEYEHSGLRTLRTG